QFRTYREFFSNRGGPKAIYAFIYAKDGGNLLKTSHLNETVQSGMLIFRPTQEQSGMLDLALSYTTRSRHKAVYGPEPLRCKSSRERRSRPRTYCINSKSQVQGFSYRKHSPNSEFISKATIFPVRAGLSLLPFLVIGFIIMATFSSVTFSISGIVLKQMNIHKITLAVMACVCPFMACGATLGAMFWCGFRFGSILCVTPFLVLAIGVDDAYLMTNAWQRITTHRRGCGWSCHPSDGHDRPDKCSHGGIRPHVLVVGKFLHTVLDSEVRHRIVEMLVETGPSVSITTITNVMAFGIGAFTPTPEIQLFSIGNALAVIVDFIFQITIYAALMVIVGRYEVEKEMNEKPAICDQIPSEKSSATIEESTKATRILDAYCDLISNKYFSSLVIAVLAVYWYVSIIGTINIKAELTPDKLFLADSDLVKIFEARNQYITTYYSVCWVLVKNPGDVMNATNSKRIHQLVEDFESLPNSVGSYSTKFWLRDYEDFRKQGEELDNSDEFDEMIGTAIEFSQNGSAIFPSVTKEQGNELKQFLEWPEFSFWKGFLQVENNGSRYTADKKCKIE
ncbi:patched family protein, partial [Ostertagia ostertagi]